MKKSLAVLLTALTVFAFAACGKNEKTTAEDTGDTGANVNVETTVDSE